MDFTGQREDDHLAAWSPSQTYDPSRREAVRPDRFAPPSPQSRGFLDAAVRGLELILRRYQKIYEYTTDDRCIFRVAPGIAEDGMDFEDGTQVRPGDPILELHLWNEHLPAIPHDGPRIAWGLVMRERALRSLALLAAHLEARADSCDIKALRGEAAFTSRIGRRQMRRVAGRYGFELFHGEPPLRRRFRYFWESFLIWGLIWTFNPGGLRGKTLIKERYELWISRDEVVRRYGHRSFSAEPLGRRAGDAPARSPRPLPGLAE